MDSLRLRRNSPGDQAEADLFSYEEPERVGPQRMETRPWIVIAVLQTFAASAVVYTAFRAFDLAPPYALVVAVCAGAALVRQAVLYAREPRWQRTRDLVK